LAHTSELSLLPISWPLSTPPKSAKFIPDYGIYSNIIFSDNTKAISIALTNTHEAYMGLGMGDELGNGAQVG
jgi:hypothetical protein